MEMHFSLTKGTCIQVYIKQYVSYAALSLTSLVSPAKPLCEKNHPMMHITACAKFSKDNTEVVIADAEIEICDNVLDVTPPSHCPLPSTYSGSWTSKHVHIPDLLKLIYKV